MKIPLRDFMLDRNILYFLVEERQLEQVKYQSIDKYSFYDATKKFGKIALTIPDI